MKRLAALAAALVMIAAAILLRGWIDDGGPGGSGGDGGDDRGGGDQTVTVACDPLLAEACEQLAEQVDGLEVEVLDAADARDRFGAPDFSPADDAVDGWLAPSPLAQMVDEDRDRAGQGTVFGELVGPLARSPLVIAMWNDRADALEGPCGGPPEWKCIGDNAGRPWSELGGEAGWGRLEPGFEPPDSTASGLMVIGQASTSYFGNPDFASNDFEGGFPAWLRNLEDSVPSFPASVGTPLDQMLTVGPSSYDLVGTVEAEAGPELSGSRDEDRVRLLYPSPMATADVVLAPVAGADGADRLTDLLGGDDAAELLARTGWRVDGQPPAPGVDDAIPLPDDDGLPRPGVLQALMEL